MAYLAGMNDDETAPQQLAALKVEHRRLDEQIAELIAEGAADQIEIARLKKRLRNRMISLP